MRQKENTLPFTCLFVYVYLFMSVSYSTYADTNSCWYDVDMTYLRSVLAENVARDQFM